MTFLAEHGTHNNPILKIVVAVLFVTFPVMGFALGMQYQAALYESNPVNRQAVLQPTLPQQDLSNQCAHNGRGDVETILTKYTVKKGDSLLSIARNELGNPSRMQELAVMNGDRYSGLFSSPGIVAANPFLEQGWVLSLPPPWITDSSGSLDIINGIILDTRPDDKALEISSRRDRSGHFASIILDEKTINKNNTKYKAGDCITAVRDIRLNKVIKIDLQSGKPEAETTAPVTQKSVASPTAVR